MKQTPALILGVTWTYSEEGIDGCHLTYMGKQTCNRHSINVECCCCSVAKSCPTLCNPMNCSTPGFPALHCCPEFAQTHVHRVGDAIQPSHPLSPPSLPALNLSQGSFPMSQFPAPSHSCYTSLEGACVHLCSIFRSCHPRDKFPECLTPLSQWAFHSWVPHYCSKQKALLNQLSPQGSAQTEQAKTPSSQPFPKTGLFTHFKSCCLLVRLRISTYLEADSEKAMAPVLLPGKSHGQRSLVGCSPWGC